MQNVFRVLLHNRYHSINLYPLIVINTFSQTERIFIHDTLSNFVLPSGMLQKRFHTYQFMIISPKTYMKWYILRALVWNVCFSIKAIAATDVPLFGDLPFHHIHQTVNLPIDTDFIHFIYQFHQSCGINARECLHGPAAPQQGMLGALIVWWPASFWLQWTVAEGTVHDGSPAKFQTKPTEG